MRTATVGVLAAIVGVSACATETVRGPQAHVAETIVHTQQAVERGKEGYAYALTQHAQIALLHAEAAQTDLKDSMHLQEGIKYLNQAILNGKANDVLQATKVAENALTHLQALSKEPVPDTSPK